MIRKQTWILLAIFVVMAGAAFYLQRHPIKNNANVTPSPTSQASLIKDWLPGDITRITFKDNQGLSVQLAQTEQGDWVLQPDGHAVDAGKVEEIRTEITSTRVITNLDPGYDLAAVGLKSPTGILTITNAKGKLVEIHIGQMTPTNNGYYVQIDQDAPSVVSSDAIESILNLISREQLLDLTPTPEASLNPESTSTP